METENDIVNETPQVEAPAEVEVPAAVDAPEDPAPEVSVVETSTEPVALADSMLVKRRFESLAVSIVPPSEVM